MSDGTPHAIQQAVHGTCAKVKGHDSVQDKRILDFHAQPTVQLQCPVRISEQVVWNMAEKKEDTGGTASEWWMKYVDQAAAALGKFGEIKLECPRCRKNLREDPKFNIIQEAIRGRYECPGCKYDLKELFTKSAVIIGNTIGKDLPVECPYCGKSAPGNTYGGNVVEGWVICPNCGRDAFDSSAQY